jgi:hypothetical protein
MAYKYLFVLLEGNDDDRFFRGILEPLLKPKYDFIIAWKYSCQKKDKVSKFIRSISSMNGDMIFISDYDTGPCVSQIKDNIISQYNILSRNDIFIVRREIESWYLAGLKCTEISHLAPAHSRSTNNLSKEDFNSSIPPKFKSRLDFMIELLKKYDIHLAMQNNDSFSRFINNYCPFDN